MTKQKLLLLTLGLAIGLLLTACAGVATGQVNLPFVGGPLVQSIELPSLALGSANVREFRAMDAARAIAQMQSQLQTSGSGHFCLGDD